MSFNVESLKDTWPEMSELIKANNEETGLVSGEAFNPDVNKYFDLERSGMIALYTYRSGGGLVGYCLFLISNHLHFPSLRFALQDALFVLPKHRGISSVRFIKWIDEQLKILGVYMVLRQVTSKVDFSRTLERLGYEMVETVYSKRLALQT